MNKRIVLAALLAPLIGGLAGVLFGPYKKILSMSLSQTDVLHILMTTSAGYVAAAYALEILVLLPTYYFLGAKRDSPAYFISTVLVGWFAATACAVHFYAGMSWPAAIPWAIKSSSGLGLPVIVVFALIGGLQGTSLMRRPELGR